MRGTRPKWVSLFGLVDLRGESSSEITENWSIFVLKSPVGQSENKGNDERGQWKRGGRRRGQAVYYSLLASIQ